MVNAPFPAVSQVVAKMDRLLQARHWKRTFANGKVSRNTVRRVFGGRDHRVSTLIALADALDCDLIIDLRPRVSPLPPPN
jgi:hypothetical protein